jgi:diguanylate cyclase (GGDEF)-like protein
MSKKLQSDALIQLIDGSAEPVLVARVDSGDWPVVLCNAAFDSLARTASPLEQPFADVLERLIGREFALEISETVRAGQETSIAVEVFGRECLLVLKPLRSDSSESRRYYVAYWRGAAGSGNAEGDMHRELARAKRRIRDLSRDDPVTGLLNEAAFRDVLAHDWAVAAREQSSLALVAFQLDDFPAYLEVFGRHASDSCLRRVAQAIRRRLRRASDVAARVDDSNLLVLAHSSTEANVTEFAEKIAAAVRELGLHHPRSNSARFVTVSYRIAVAAAKGSGSSDFLKRVLAD